MSAHKRSLPEPKVLTPTIVAGLLAYFEKGLGQSLLYDIERGQYLDFRAYNVTGQHVVVGAEVMTYDYYGGEHLLRLIGAFEQTIVLRC